MAICDFCEKRPAEKAVGHGICDGEVYCARCVRKIDYAVKHMRVYRAAPSGKSKKKRSGNDAAWIAAANIPSAF